MKFHKFEKVRVIGKETTGWSGVVLICNQSDFGETYWIRWDDGESTLMHGDNLEKANVDFQAGKP